jgi:two-component system chemotaxis response regulator CheY
VNGFLVVDAALRQRLWRDCAMHETLVHEVTHATGAGQLEPDVALRSIALELHSVKGVASVLGCAPILAAIGTLGEALLHRNSVTRPAFWAEFAEWFSSLMGCLRASVDGELDQAVLDAMSARRDELLLALGETRDVWAVQRAADPRPKLSPSAGRRLLLVDDSATVRAAMSARLTDRGYPVRSARSLTETAQILSEFDPEIVVTDVRMPEVEGDELCRRIKSQMMRVVPVILYSGLPEEELAERARSANADAYVCKIRGIDGLIERMDELLSDEILF